MAYKRSELQRDKTWPEEKIIIEVLLKKLKDGEVLTVSESKYVCSKSKFIKSSDTHEPIIDAADYPQCADSIFFDTYLVYFNNIDGWNRQLDLYRNEIPLTARLEAAAILNTNYLKWNADVIASKPLKNSLLRLIQIEANRQLKKLKEYCKQVYLGNNRYIYLAKATVLHSKFLYLTVLDYYQDGNEKEKVIHICNQKIVIEQSAYVHILFRHYAAQVKEHQYDKSYHSGDFDHRQMPDEIFNILNEYSKIVDCNLFNREYLFFRLNGTTYAIWWKETERTVKNMAKEIVLPVRTLYPVKENRDLKKIAKLKEVKLSDILSIFQ